MECIAMCFRQTKYLSTIILLICINSHVSFAATGDAEEKAAIELEKAGGWVSKNSEGRIESVTFISMNDQLIERIDFSHCTQVKRVMIIGRRLTNRTLIHLQKMPAKLERIYIVQSNITDEGFANFVRTQPFLREVAVVQVSISNQSLTALGNLADLEMLHLQRTKITDKGLNRLVKLQQLHSLNLGENDITDVGLHEIGKIANLSCLYLNHTKITDNGIMELRTLRNLSKLEVYSTKITAEGGRALQTMLPMLNSIGLGKKD
jgi:internalin A